MKLCICEGSPFTKPSFRQLPASTPLHTLLNMLRRPHFLYPSRDYPYAHLAVHPLFPSAPRVAPLDLSRLGVSVMPGPQGNHVPGHRRGKVRPRGGPPVNYALVVEPHYLVKERRGEGEGGVGAVLVCCGARVSIKEPLVTRHTILQVTRIVQNLSG